MCWIHIDYWKIAGDLLDLVGDSSFEIVQDLIMVRIATAVDFHFSDFGSLAIFLFLLTHLFKKS